MKSMHIMSIAKVARIPGSVPSLPDLLEDLRYGINANISSLLLKYSKFNR
jgi:hypothetical protein